MKHLILPVIMVLATLNAYAYTLKGIVLNTTNDSAVSDAIILLLQNNKVVASSNSNFVGEFKINAKKGREYVLEIVKDGYKTESTSFILSQELIDTDPFITVYMHPLLFNPNLEEMQKGMEEKELNPDIMEDIGNLSALPEGYKIIEAKPLKTADNKQSNFNVNLNRDKEKTNVNVEVLKESFNKEKAPKVKVSESDEILNSYYQEGNIYYSAGKAMLEPQVKEMLDQMSARLNNNIESGLKITAYADADKEAEIGDYISKLRVEELTNYLLKKGVSFSQLTISVVGNTYLPNGCLKGVKCSPEEHAENRKLELLMY